MLFPLNLNAYGHELRQNLIEHGKDTFAHCQLPGAQVYPWPLQYDEPVARFYSQSGIFHFPGTSEGVALSQPFAQRTCDRYPFDNPRAVIVEPLSRRFTCFTPPQWNELIGVTHRDICPIG